MDSFLLDNSRRDSKAAPQGQAVLGVSSNAVW